MHPMLTTLHALLNTNSFESELVILGILAFGWILGSTSAEHAAALQRPNTGPLLIARLCGLLAVLLILGIIIDSLWFHSYARLLLLGGLLFGIMLVATIFQRQSQHAAHQAMLADGYPRVVLAGLPKKRES